MRLVPRNSTTGASAVRRGCGRRGRRRRRSLRGEAHRPGAATPAARSMTKPATPQLLTAGSRSLSCDLHSAHLKRGIADPVVRVRRARPHRAARRQLRPGARRVPGDPRPVGQRQDDAARPAGRARPPALRTRRAGRRGPGGARRGRARAAARREGRLRLPVVPAAARADGARERAGAAGAARRGGGGAAPRGRAAGARRPGRPRPSLPGAALGRRAAARRARARVQPPAAPAVRRRADREPGRGHGRAR